MPISEFYAFCFWLEERERREREEIDRATRKPGTHSQSVASTINALPPEKRIEMLKAAQAAKAKG